MTITYVSKWFSAGSEAAVVSFVKGMLRHAAAGALQYGFFVLGLWHPTAVEAVLAQGILDRLMKSLGIWLGTSPVVSTSATTVSAAVSPQEVSAPIQLEEPAV